MSLSSNIISKEKRHHVYLLFCGNDHDLCFIMFEIEKKTWKKMAAAVVSENENQKEYNEFKSCRMDLGKNCGIKLRLTRYHMYVNFGKVSIKKN